MVDGVTPGWRSYVRFFAIAPDIGRLVMKLNVKEPAGEDAQEGPIERTACRFTEYNVWNRYRRAIKQSEREK
jgi:hypothetical protein